MINRAFPPSRAKATNTHPFRLPAIVTADHLSNDNERKAALIRTFCSLPARWWWCLPRDMGLASRPSSNMARTDEQTTLDRHPHGPHRPDHFDSHLPATYPQSALGCIVPHGRFLGAGFGGGKVGR